MFPNGSQTNMYLKLLYTCVSVSIKDVATSKRFGRDRYLFSLNWCSSSRSCWLVNAVLGLLHFPSKFDWAWAGKQNVSSFLYSWGQEKNDINVRACFYIRHMHGVWIHYSIDSRLRLQLNRYMPKKSNYFCKQNE